jgi:membrane protein implicated in regulation of membrane protease activity
MGVNTVYLIVWIVLAVIFAVAEMATTQLVSVWFAVGAAVAAVVAGFGAEPWIQLLVFALISGTLLILTRTLVKQLTKNKLMPTNADRAIGKTAVVLTDVSPDEVGTVSVNGQEWSAVSVSGRHSAGDKVLVRAIEGVKLIIEELPSTAKL